MGKNIEITVNEQEKKLLELIRSMLFGEVKIVIQNSVPVRVEEMRKSIKL